MEWKLIKIGKRGEIGKLELRFDILESKKWGKIN